MTMSTYAYIEPHCNNYMQTHDYTVHCVFDRLPYVSDSAWWLDLPEWPLQSDANGCVPAILVEYDPVGPLGNGIALKPVSLL